jgi:hypothetical protein
LIKFAQFSLYLLALRQTARHTETNHLSVDDLAIEFQIGVLAAVKLVGDLEVDNLRQNQDFGAKKNSRS